MLLGVLSRYVSACRTLIERYLTNNCGRHGLLQNHVRTCTLGFVSSRAFLVLHPNIVLKPNIFLEDKVFCQLTYTLVRWVCAPRGAFSLCTCLSNPHYKKCNLFYLFSIRRNIKKQSLDIATVFLLIVPHRRVMPFYKPAV